MSGKALTTDSIPDIVRGTTDKVIQRLLEELGLDKLSDLNLRIEAIANGVPEQVTKLVGQHVRDRSVVRTMIQTLSQDEQSCVNLVRALEPARRQSRSEADQRRLEKLTEGALSFYRERNPDIEAQYVSDLVSLMDEKHVVQGKRDHVKAVADWITAQEARMTELIQQMVKTRPKKPPEEMVPSFAKLIVLEGANADIPTQVRERLEKKDPIKDFLKRS